MFGSAHVTPTQPHNHASHHDPWGLALPLFLSSSEFTSVLSFPAGMPAFPPLFSPNILKFDSDFSRQAVQQRTQPRAQEEQHSRQERPRRSAVLETTTETMTTFWQGQTDFTVLFTSNDHRNLKRSKSDVILTNFQRSALQPAHGFAAAHGRAPGRAKLKPPLGLDVAYIHRYDAEIDKELFQIAGENNDLRIQVQLLSKLQRAELMQLVTHSQRIDALLDPDAGVGAETEGLGAPLRTPQNTKRVDAPSDPGAEVRAETTPFKNLWLKLKTEGSEAPLRTPSKSASAPNVMIGGASAATTPLKDARKRGLPKKSTSLASSVDRFGSRLRQIFTLKGRSMMTRAVDDFQDDLGPLTANADESAAESAEACPQSMDHIRCNDYII